MSSARERAREHGENDRHEDGTLRPDGARVLAVKVDVDAEAFMRGSRDLRGTRRRPPTLARRGKPQSFPIAARFGR